MINFEGLTPEQRKAIIDLNKRIRSLESKLVILQARLVQVDPTVSAGLAESAKTVSLN